MTEEIKNKTINHVWSKFNAALNQAVHWDTAKADLLAWSEQQKKAFDDGFQIDPDDPLKSEAVWTEKMNGFDFMIETIQQIPTYE